MRRFLMIASLCLLPVTGWAEDGPVRLYAAPELVETGLMKYILPRFSLKTQVRVALVEDAAEAHLSLGDEGRALFAGQGATWRLGPVSDAHPGAARLADWLRSEVGTRAIYAYAPEGEALFTEPQEQEVAVATIEITGDVTLGHTVSNAKCARCHAVDQRGKMNDIGSTPSFFLLRAFPDWVERFEAFYVLKPHAAFTQIEGVTEPFPIDRPSPIVPVTMTLEDLDAIMAYMQSLEPADLGAPIALQ